MVAYAGTGVPIPLTEFAIAFSTRGDEDIATPAGIATPELRRLIAPWRYEECTSWLFWDKFA